MKVLTGVDKPRTALVLGPSIVPEVPRGEGGIGGWAGGVEGGVVDFRIESEVF